MKKIFLILILFLILFQNSYAKNTVYTNEKTGYEVVIEDDAELLTEQEEKQLEDEMIPLTEYGHIIFKSIEKNYNSTTASYARDYYHQNFNTESGTVFVIDMDKRQIYIFSDGKNYIYITSDKATIITDNVYQYASQQKYYECASNAFKQSHKVLKGEKIEEPLRLVTNFLLAIISAFYAAFIIVGINDRKRRINIKDVIKKSRVYVNIRNVRGVKTGQHRVYNPSTDSSSGGSSGGGGGGGGSSGGGGGHGF